MSDRLDSVLDKLEGVKLRGGQFVARCPAHADRSPSLSLTEAANGTILFYCHAGCSADSIRDKLGLTWEELFGVGDITGNGKRRFDERGTHLESIMCCQRLQTETHVLRQLESKRGWSSMALASMGVGWDGERLTIPLLAAGGNIDNVLRYDALGVSRGPKMFSMKGRPRSMWPPPETVDTTLSSRYLILVEGEGTALSVASLGLPVVALPGSVSRASGNVARPSSFSGGGWTRKWAGRFNKHRRIVIIADCDQPGRTLAETVKYDLLREWQAFGTTATVVDIAPERNDGADVGDWAKPFTTDRLRAQAREILEMLISCSTHDRNMDHARLMFRDFSRWAATGQIKTSVAETPVIAKTSKKQSELPWDINR